MTMCEKCGCQLNDKYALEWRYCETCRGIDKNNDEQDAEIDYKRESGMSESIKRISNKDFYLLILLPNIIIQLIKNYNYNFAVIFGSIAGAVLITFLISLLGIWIVGKRAKDLAEKKIKIFGILLGYIVVYGLTFLNSFLTSMI